MPSLSCGGRVQATSWAVSVPNSAVPIHGAAHCWRASDVHATARPSPYCHWASSGSSRAVRSATVALPLAVVAL